MARESSARRAEFSPGIPVRLADGRTWILPGPSNPSCQGPEYEGLLVATGQAEDDAELRRAELALAIYLLGCNYDLGPDDYLDILECPSGGRTLAEMQRAFREAASAHAERRGWPRRTGPDRDGLTLTAPAGPVAQGCRAIGEFSRVGGRSPIGERPADGES